MFYRKNRYHIYLTADTVRGMLLETGRHPGNECIIQMPGLRIGDEFFFDMAADSGIHATYTSGMCEKDHEYADHLSTRLSEYYDFSKGTLTVSQVHKHPSGYERFSPGDHPANAGLARQFGGVVNGLILVDPEFRVKFWYIDEDGRETPAAYEINDQAVQEAMPRISLKKLQKTVETSERDALRARQKEREALKVCDFETFRRTQRPYRVLLPEEYRDSRYEGPFAGYYVPETKTYNVVTDRSAEERGDVRTLELSAKWRGDSPKIRVKGEEESNVTVEYYSLEKDVFSRNRGILERSRMSSKQAVIAGAGSGGFKAGMDLVRAGIGSVVIADDDIMAYHNVGRHVCGIHDVGRYKVDCFKERAADINPGCRVYTFRELIQHVDPAELEQVIWKDSIILCCADNRHAGYVCNELADQYHIPMIDAGCGPGASTGEIFFYKPDSGMACYTCAYGEDRGVDHSDQAVRRRFYATEEELEKMHFQPGMFMDIELTAIFEAKLAVDLLMEGEEGYEMKLLPYIGQCTVLLNYPVDPDVNPYMRLFGGDEKDRRPLTWKSGTARKSESCTHCRQAVQ